MSDTISEVSVFEPTNQLSQFFGEPALVGQEKLETYKGFLSLVASSIKPTDPMGWFLTKNVTDLLWDIRREQIVKADIIKVYQKEIVAELIKSLAPPGQLTGQLTGQLGATTYRIFQADNDLTLWEADSEARVKIDAALAEKGHTTSAILAQAYIRGASHIDAIDRRIAGYERRRDTILREAGLWNDRLARKLGEATTAIIDGEFTEAAAED